MLTDERTRCKSDTSECHSLRAFHNSMISNETDQQLATQIYLDYRAIMHRFAYRYFGNRPADIEDAVSIAMENVCRYIDRLHDEKCSNRRAYIISIIGNVCRRQITASTTKDSLYDYSVTQDDIENISDSFDVFESAFAYSNMQTLLNSLEMLSDKEKDIIRMRHIDKLEFCDISKQLHMSEGSVRVAITRAKKRVQKNIGAEWMKRYEHESEKY